MGANISSQLNESTTKVVNNVLTDIAVKIDNNVLSVQNINQTIYLAIVDSKVAGDVKVQQKAAMSVTAILQADTNLKNTIANDITTKLKETMANTVKQANSDLNIGQANIAVAENRTNSYIETNIKTLLSTGLENSVTNIGNSRSVLNMDVIRSEVGGNVDISQESQITAISKNIAKTIVENSIKNALTTDITKELSNTADQKNTGINLIAGLGLIVVIVGGVLILRFSMSGKAMGAEVKAFKNEAKLQEEVVPVKPGAYGGVKKGKKPTKPMVSTKTKVIIGCIIIIIIILILWYLKRQQIAKTYVVPSYLKGEPLGTRSGFMSGFTPGFTSGCKSGFKPGFKSKNLIYY